jgi:hypothetical protein
MLQVQVNVSCLEAAHRLSTHMKLAATVSPGLNSKAQASAVAVGLQKGAVDMHSPLRFARTARVGLLLSWRAFGPRPGCTLLNSTLKMRCLYPVRLPGCACSENSLCLLSTVWEAIMTDRELRILLCSVAVISFSNSVDSKSCERAVFARSRR